MTVEFLRNKPQGKGTTKLRSQNGLVKMKTKKKRLLKRRWQIWN